MDYWRVLVAVGVERRVQALWSTDTGLTQHTMCRLAAVRMVRPAKLVMSVNGAHSLPMADFVYKSANFRASAVGPTAFLSTLLRRTGREMAELLMKSAIIRSAQWSQRDGCRGHDIAPPDGAKTWSQTVALSVSGVHIMTRCRAGTGRKCRGVSTKQRPDQLAIIALDKRAPSPHQLTYPFFRSHIAASSSRSPGWPYPPPPEDRQMMWSPGFTTTPTSFDPSTLSAPSETIV